MTPVFTCSIPVQLLSEANAHTHWRVRARRAKAQRWATFAAILSACRCAIGHDPTWLLSPSDGAVRVHMVRVSPGTLDDDNLAGAFKHVRDEIAALLGVDDRDPRVAWTWSQRRGRSAKRPIPAEYACEVTVYRGTVASDAARRKGAPLPPSEPQIVVGPRPHFTRSDVLRMPLRRRIVQPPSAPNRDEGDEHE